MSSLSASKDFGMNVGVEDLGYVDGGLDDFGDFVVELVVVE